MPKREWKIVRPNQYVKMVENAKNDPDTAASVIVDCVARLKRGEPIPTELAQFLADALSKCIKRPEKAGQALGLIGTKRGRPKVVDERKRALDEAMYAACVLVETRKNTQLRKSPTKKVGRLSAFEHVAKGLGSQPSASAVEQAWRRYGERGAAKVLDVLERQRRKKS